ncbi:MAG: YggS family pyridoxal phosphate-dependent enzyme [Gemmataceae bacterium]|nr:YggS family pyridoxal phosphate-dependent enzyme [Gemmataceae bacterium]
MDQPGVRKLLAERLAAVEERLQAACRRAGRRREEVTLVAVTKTVDAAVAALLPELGVFDLGENRPQELWRKAAALPGTVRWHLIGHLQRNKVAATLPRTTLIHSVDSLRLLEAIESAAARRQSPVEVLLEIHAGLENSKQGFRPDDLAALLEAVKTLRWTRLRGLMTMAPLQAAEACRPIFAALRRQRDQLKRQLPPPHDLVHLSMGMSNDFEVAVEEGATFVRLGSVLFDGLMHDAPPSWRN